MFVCNNRTLGDLGSHRLDLHANPSARHRAMVPQLRHDSALKRQERAREMKARGQTPKAIAKELDIDTETVKRWLSPRKG